MNEFELHRHLRRVRALPGPAARLPYAHQQLSQRQQQWRDEQELFESRGLTARKFCDLH
jgi:hypothetical protein